MFAEQVELPTVVVTFWRDGFVVTAYLGEVARLELQGDLHQRVGNVSGGFIGDGVFGRLGALLALYLGGIDLSVIGIIGIILLIGIVKKNGIMLVDFAIVAERDRGLAPVEAIRVMMTTAAAMLAGIPLMLGHGTGSELRQPLGYAMVGGLALSQLLTLYTTPVVYLYLDRLQTFLFGKPEAHHEEAIEVPITRARSTP